jgi:hypothetical protein
LVEIEAEAIIAQPGEISTWSPMLDLVLHERGGDIGAGARPTAAARQRLAGGGVNGSVTATLVRSVVPPVGVRRCR